MKRIIKINFICLLILVICSLSCVSVFASNVQEFIEEQNKPEEVVEEEAEEKEETELDTLKNKKNELSETVSNSYLQMGFLQNQMSVVLCEVEQLNLTILEKQSEIQILEAEEEKLQGEIERVKEDLEVTTDLYNEKKKILSERLVAIYEMGETTYLDMLLHSKSLTEFLSTYYMISEIAKVDQDMIDSFAQTKSEMEKLSSALANNQKILEQSLESKEKAKIVLENTLIIQNSKLDSLSVEERELHDELSAYEEELSNLEAEIRLLSLASVGAEYIGGVMAWPVPGYTRITSQYGMRTHPITGVYKLHTGVDIGAPLGAQFVAANDGLVVKAGYNLAYGNMVILDHGGGIQTLYAHGSAILVEVGDIVVQGTPILAVGSTGYSTGPHAHFEVRVDGKCVEPLDYITSYNSTTKLEEKKDDKEEIENEEETKEEEEYNE